MSDHPVPPPEYWHKWNVPPHLAYIGTDVQTQGCTCAVQTLSLELISQPDLPVFLVYWFSPILISNSSFFLFLNLKKTHHLTILPPPNSPVPVLSRWLSQVHGLSSFKNFYFIHIIGEPKLLILYSIAFKDVCKTYIYSITTYKTHPRQGNLILFVWVVITYL